MTNGPIDWVRESMAAAGLAKVLGISQDDAVALIAIQMGGPDGVQAEFNRWRSRVAGGDLLEAQAQSKLLQEAISNAAWTIILKGDPQ